MKQRESAIAAVREFNRFYTSIIGVLDKHILNSRYSLPEARIMYEINRLQQCTARQIRDEIDMDEGYLSRTVDKLMKQGIVEREKSAEDGRVYFLSLTAEGKRQFDCLDRASHDDIGQLLDKLPAEEIPSLVTHLEATKAILSRTI